MDEQRHVATLDSDNDIENLTTLLAYTYGHTIPLVVRVEEVEGEQKTVLKLDENKVPDHLVIHSRQICNIGYRRYHNQE